MAVTTVTIPAVVQTTINHKVKIVTTKIVMAVEAVLEIIVAVAIMVEIMDMEVEVEEVAIVIILVEVMVEVFQIL